MAEIDQHARMAEALLFIAARLPEGADVDALLARLRAEYAERGVHLVRVAGKWALRTAPDLTFLLRRDVETVRALSRAAVETLAIIAYHQPLTRAEVEEIRGVGLSRGTLDRLMEAGWVRPVGRRRTPGRPVTYGTSEGFLDHFGLESVEDLPGVEELKAAGLLDSRPTPVPIGGAPREAGDDEEGEADGAEG